MPINATVTNSEKISLQEFVVKILLFALTASRLNAKVYFFHLVCHGLYTVFTGHTKNSKLNGFKMNGRL